LLRQDIEFNRGEAQEAAFTKITILFACGKTPVLRQYDPNIPALLGTHASDSTIAGILSQQFEDGKIHPVRCVLTKLNSAELNYDVYDKEMLAVVHSLNKSRHFLQEAIHKTTIYSDHQNLKYFKTAILMNQRQAGWAEQLKQYTPELLYRKGSSNANADILSRFPVFTSRGRGKTSATNKTMLRKEQWSDIGAIQIEDDSIETSPLAVLDVEILLPEAKARIQEKAMLDDNYRKICKQVTNKANINEGK